tara:strand:- start:487 stop:720 length:234 start_codon:yes stop_codon:yes gene_type:complete
MGKMKLIYEMIQNGTSQAFIDAYRKAKLTNAIGFTYDFIFYDIIRARAFVLVIKKAQKEYDKHIDRQAELDQAAIEL